VTGDAPDAFPRLKDWGCFQESAVSHVCAQKYFIHGIDPGHDLFFSRRADASRASAAASCVPAIGCTEAPPMSAAHELPSQRARRGRHPADRCGCGHSRYSGVCRDGRGGRVGEPTGNSALYPTSQRARARATRLAPHGLSRACVRAAQPHPTAARPRAARRAVWRAQHTSTIAVRPPFSRFRRPPWRMLPSAARPAGRLPP